ncbi:hypothetical protein PR202_ga00526 [Eleusine coracana subsp. coracana]|uniref:Uncharacterized protein n=1 Tax=Eleusine coracana subsp. coracana TaxID=191504 RepID=A0AAV5BGR2_ELECO|nr:hypothetical protein PR202_ga00526 [Eleusine coracana subsp. coracana]
MPFRPGLPLRLLLPYLRRRPPPSRAPVRRRLFSFHVAASAAATESEEDAIIGRDAPLAPARVGLARGAAWVGLEAGKDKAELDRKASIAERFRVCHELLWQRRWREMRDCLAELVSEHGTDLFLCF